jgi:ABC-type cobalamin/Fe3+-siderophores transport system ATPase subunit
VLDEPTNHLDIPSKETLEEAIRCFEGAVIAVSHDRYFLKRIATRVLLVRGCSGGCGRWGEWMLWLSQCCQHGYKRNICIFIQRKQRDGYWQRH